MVGERVVATAEGWEAGVKVEGLVEAGLVEAEAVRAAAVAMGRYIRKLSIMDAICIIHMHRHERLPACAII